MELINDIDIQQQQDELMTKRIHKAVIGTFMLGPLFYIFTQLGFFSITLTYCLICTSYAIAVWLIAELFIRKSKLIFVKYFQMITLEIMIGILSANSTIGIYMSYFALPLLSCVYLDWKFTRKVSIVGYIVLLIFFIPRSIGFVNNGFTNFESIPKYYIAYMLGYTMEYVFMSIFAMLVARHGSEVRTMYFNAKKESIQSEAANVAKSSFLANMSHEIRTPINTILGMNEMVLRESRDDEIRKYSMDIESSARSLLRIINDILDSTKIESGKMEIVPVEYELASLINDVVNMIMPRANQKDIEIIVNVQADLPQMMVGDDIRINQILMNLLSNGVKYTPNGYVKLSVSGRRDGIDEILHFEVEDSGIGIKEEDMPKLFAAFERIEENRNRSIEGTGLGMNITLQILALMGSKLNVESVYGKGTKFSFDLIQPICGDGLIGDFRIGTRVNEDIYTYRTTFVAPTAKVLLVDDNDMNRKVFINLLKNTKVQITDVSSGRACLDRVSKEHYDIIFLDHMMPEMDGIETFELMKSHEHKCKNSPVIMLTANAVIGAKEQYLRLGFDNFLSKPISPTKLEEMLVEYLPKDKVDTNVEQEPIRASAPEPIDIDGMPEIEEIDWEYAIARLMDAETALEVATDFYTSMDAEMDKLNEFYSLTDNQEGLNSYRIQVHAIKSSSATIGALTTSKLARLLEFAARDNDMERIHTLHPVLIEEMQKLKQQMSVLSNKDSEVSEFNAEEVSQLLMMLQMSVNNSDVDTADIIMEQILQYQYNDVCKSKIDELNRYILNLETDKALEIINELIADIAE